MQGRSGGRATTLRFKQGAYNSSQTWLCDLDHRCFAGIDPADAKRSCPGTGQNSPGRAKSRRLGLPASHCSCSSAEALSPQDVGKIVRRRCQIQRGELVINLENHDLETTASDGEAVTRRECSCFCTGTLFRTSELLLWRGHLLGFGSLAILGYNFCASRFPRQFIGEGVRNVNLPKRLLDAT
jgi:hypothetical protein